ncbi:MAG: InlB B-repeat-containing protein, partial [Candidatus Aenigmatarchaeota archaeon]
PSDIQWLANDKNGRWTVNPFAHNDIRFALQYMNRESMIEDLQDGFADPRYGFMATSLEVWQERFVEPIEDNYGLSSEGDRNLMETIVEEAMEEMKDEVAFGEVSGSIGDGWYYNPPDGEEHQIEVKIIARVEDWRLELGRHMESVLDDLGFDAWVEPVDSATAIPMAFYGSPEPYDNLDYHIYTGGWISTTAVYYQEASCAQMYAPWYGFTQTYGSEDHWQYDDEGYDQQIGPSDRVRDEWIEDPHAGKTVADMDQQMMDLFTGKLETEDEYWDMKIGSTQMGLEESVRIFQVTQQAFYPYNPDTMHSSVPESINGYDTYFGPRTMRTDDGHLDSAVLTGEDRPFMDNWNLYGGSSDVYGEYPRRMAREYGAWMNPQNGMPMEVNNYWTEGRETDPYDRNGSVETDYEYQEGELIENIDIPETAVDYVPSVDGENVTREWYNRDELIDAGLIEDDKAAVKATIDVHEDHVWHDGSDFSLQDLMASYARSKELGDPTGDPYLEAHSQLNAPWWDSIHAIEWNAEEGTYTVYGDYTFPLEDKVGNYYSIFPEVNPLTYEGWDHLHGETDIYDAAGIDESYDYEPGADNWIHQISAAQNEDLVAILETIIGEEYLPPYLDEANNAPIPADFSEVETELNSLIDFINEYDHSYVGCGPFYIEEYTTDNELELQRWDDYGYPFEGEEAGGQTFEYGYWAEQFDISEVRLDSINAPDVVNLGEEFDADGSGHLANLYPEPEELALTEDNMEDYRFTLRTELGGEIVVEVGANDVDLDPQDTFTDFMASIPTEDLDRGGHYTLQLEARGIEDPTYTTMSTTVVIADPDVGLVANDWTIPEEVDVDSDGNIWAEVENTGDEDDTAQITLIDQETGAEEMIYDEEIPAGETVEIDYDHTFDTPGVYTVELRDGEDRYVEEFGQITVLGPDIEAVNLDVDPIFGEAPLNVTIGLSAENYGTAEGDIELLVDDEVIETYTVSADEAIFETAEYTFEDVGSYEVKFGELTTPVEVVETAILRPVELTVPEEVTVGDNGTISATVDSQVEETTAHLYVDGEEVHVEDITSTGEVTFEYDYTFDEAGEIEVEVHDEEGNAILSDTVTVFDLFELDVNTEGEGDVEVDPEEDTYGEGTEVTLTASPAEDWEFVEWTGDVDTIEDTEEAETTITMDGDKNITAVFQEAVEYYTLAVDVDGEGEVQIDPDQDEYEEGTEVTLTASPADDYEFVEWTGDASGEEEEITVTMDEDKTVTAVFEEEDDGDGTPGFTLPLLALAAVVAVAIYYSKKRR